MMQASSDIQMSRNTDLQTRNEELEKRMLTFAANIIRELEKHRRLPQSITNQLARSAAGIGANYAEACNAVSKSDFKNKVAISKKEAAESRYWIDLCRKLTKPESWTAHRKEARELLLILQSIINSFRSHNNE